MTDVPGLPEQTVFGLPCKMMTLVDTEFFPHGYHQPELEAAQPLEVIVSHWASLAISCLICAHSLSK